MFGHSQTSNLGSWRKDVFKRRTSTGSGLLAFLGSGFAKIFGQIMSVRVKTLSNKNVVESRHIKREFKASLLVNVRCSKTSLLKFPKANEQEQHVTSLCKAAPALKQNRNRAAVRRLSNICSFQIVKALTRQWVSLCEQLEAIINWKKLNTSATCNPERLPNTTVSQ